MQYRLYALRFRGEDVLKGRWEQNNTPLFFFCFVVISIQTTWKSVIFLDGPTCSHRKLFPLQLFSSSELQESPARQTNFQSHELGVPPFPLCWCRCSRSVAQLAQPIRFPQWAQTITRSLYPPNTEQIRGLYSPDCRGRRSRGVFLKLQLLPTPDEEK